MNAPIPGIAPEESEQTKHDIKKLVEHLNKLKLIATKGQPTDRLKMCQKYYLGRFESSDTINGRDSESYNIIKPIIETKISLALDSDVTTTVNPVVGSMANIQELTEVEDIADIGNDILDNIKRVNQFERFGARALRSIEKFGIGVGRSSWDEQALQGIGEVKIDLVDPLDFYPDPSGKTIEDCNYIFIKNKYSAITLKRRYPDRIKDIDKLLKTSGSDSDGGKTVDQSDYVVTYHNDQTSGQMYVSDNRSVDNLSKSVDVWECYLRDDSTFIPDGDASTTEKEEKARIGFRYPYGRLIIYSGDSSVFEDKPIDIPTGFPIKTFNLYPSDDIWGQGDVEPLKSVQDRINRAYIRLQLLVGGFVSTILMDELLGITDENEMVNKLIQVIPTGVLNTGRAPQVLTNNTLSEIKSLIELIQLLKSEAREIGRVNEQMISGESQKNVNSAKMVESLNESPMTSIREIQGNFYQFLIDVSNQAIVIAQNFYKVPRIIRIADGKEFISLTPKTDSSDGNMQRVSVKNKTLELVNEIKSDFSLTEFECEVSTGKDLPKSRGAVAEITMNLWEKGVFGDPNSIDARKLVLQALDYPNRRAIVDKMEEAAKEQEEAPPISPPVDKISMAFKDLPPTSQFELLKKNGLAPEEAPIPPQGNEMQPEPPEGEILGNENQAQIL